MSDSPTTPHPTVHATVSAIQASLAEAVAAEAAAAEAAELAISRLIVSARQAGLTIQQCADALGWQPSRVHRVSLLAIGTDGIEPPRQPPGRKPKPAEPETAAPETAAADLAVFVCG